MFRDVVGSTQNCVCTVLPFTGTFLLYFFKTEHFNRSHQQLDAQYLTHTKLSLWMLILPQELVLLLLGFTTTKKYFCLFNFFSIVTAFKIHNNPKITTADKAQCFCVILRKTNSPTGIHRFLTDLLKLIL